MRHPSQRSRVRALGIHFATSTKCWTLDVGVYTGQWVSSVIGEIVVRGGAMVGCLVVEDSYIRYQDMCVRVLIF